MRSIALALCVAFSLAASAVDLESLVGEDWYGLYFNGQKAGFAKESVSLAKDGALTMSEEVQFRIKMSGNEQNMQLRATRVYNPDGELGSAHTQVIDQSGKLEFTVKAKGDQFMYTSIVGGAKSERLIPNPHETLDEVLSQTALAHEDAAIGDSAEYEMFDPMNEMKLKHKSAVIGIEERVFDGVPTKVFVIQTTAEPIGIESTSYVTVDGTVLEDVYAGTITMRLEPKEVAQDVNYSNDVIISNAALVDELIDNPRSRDSLELQLTGPLTPSHLFNDERQFIAAEGNQYSFRAKRISMDGVTTPSLPVQDEAMQDWLQATTFVQSDDARLISKAQEIIGSETNALKASELLCHWVYQNVQTSFSARLTNSLEVLDSLAGDCTEHSMLFIGLARAAGLPAREVAGLVYVDGPPAGFYFHQWAKVWVGKWIDVDPTFDQPFADVTHIKLAEGDLFEQIRLVPIIGQLQVSVVDGPDSP
jgi:hypothetical protein